MVADTRVGRHHSPPSQVIFRLAGEEKDEIAAFERECFLERKLLGGLCAALPLATMPRVACANPETRTPTPFLLRAFAATTRCS